MKNNIFLFFSILLIWSCKKDNELPINIMDGKLKSINYFNYRPNDTFVDNFTFYYDSISGDLIKGIHTNDYPYSIISPVDSVIITKMNSTTIRLHYFETEGTSFDYSYYAYLNNAGYVYAISIEYPFRFDRESMYLYLVYDVNQNLDTIYEPLGANPATFQTTYHTAWNFTSDGNNFIQTTTYSSYDPNQPLSGAPTVFDYTFTNHPNTGLVPLQRIYAHGMNYREHLLEPMYLLNIAGYKFDKANKNLINTFYNGVHLDNYTYEFNSDNRVTGMFDSNEYYELIYH